ncbi:type I DNA topoisomerase [Candidatus Roizmanbacteria bacterium CG10_big_fil_rev_8_21_14_0_10_45_7]|uniref:DNA topoisomerase 1 n=1 Tax=Candidatus Roizmanbacteria bacterium CG10_big_fil_rev_8_21_14_0_10_45_7 TaxID=1974854 RepID=A0A2M8KV18_9BACT|nr:MAG: type I DNA topoisomerase [Candidatus Roizmanbacteria bacterium CG10_big_fil_rev_8_21_14_0_10_45_7]
MVQWVFMQLLIVESPTKARTFGKLMGSAKHDDKAFEIVSSMGHVRDLPAKKLGVDVEHDFEPIYEVLQGKQKLVSELISKAKKAKTVILATDPDREGEAIAYHLEVLIKEKVPKAVIKRIVFHEITQSALEHALTQSRDVNIHLFHAQQARRILDRLVGYKVSPYLWTRFSKRWLSAGRVQTVALRFVVEREKERNGFATQKYFTFNAEFNAGSVPSLICDLEKLKSEPFFTTKKHELFDGSYSIRVSNISDEKMAQDESSRLNKETYVISEVKEEVVARSPQPPFTTSTLQQFASTNFGYSAKRTMSIAQKLYENGHISYHRTDSLTLSDEFVSRARSQVTNTYGADYLHETNRVYKNKNSHAQEAHEAIRPTDVEQSVIAELAPEAAKLYNAIYARAIATQMKDAQVRRQKIVVESALRDQFTAEHEQVEFLGFLKLYGDHKDTRTLAIKQGEKAQLTQLTHTEKQTLPPPRYTEATLIKTLEKRGIGRPSTYAPIVSLIQERQYVKKEERSLAPTELGAKISDVLSESFAQVFDVTFTAHMEEDLDRIAQRSENWKQMIGVFYASLAKQLETASKLTEKIRVEETTDEKCPECSKPLVIKMSRFGKFYACTGFPDCKFTKQFLQKTGVMCPECGKGEPASPRGELVVRFSKKRRRFYACDQYPACKYTTLWLKKESKEQNEPASKEKEQAGVNDA